MTISTDMLPVGQPSWSQVSLRVFPRTASADAVTALLGSPGWSRKTDRWTRAFGWEDAASVQLKLNAAVAFMRAHVDDFGRVEGGVEIDVLVSWSPRAPRDCFRLSAPDLSVFAALGANLALDLSLDELPDWQPGATEFSSSSATMLVESNGSLVGNLPHPFALIVETSHKETWEARLGASLDGSLAGQLRGAVALLKDSAGPLRKLQRPIEVQLRVEWVPRQPQDSLVFDDRLWAAVAEVDGELNLVVRQGGA